MHLASFTTTYAVVDTSSMCGTSIMSVTEQSKAGLENPSMIENTKELYSISSGQQTLHAVTSS